MDVVKVAHPVQITPTVSIPDRAVSCRFVRSAGPGGQNVNKVATAVELRLDLAASELPSAVQERVLALSGQRATKDRQVVIFAQRHRTQALNRRDAEQRLRELVERALRRRRPRVPTRPSAAVRRRRQESKQRRSSVKRVRRKSPLED